MSAALSHKGRRTSKPRRCGTTPAKTTRTPACIQQDTALKQKPEGFYFSASTPPRPKRLNCQKCTEEQRFLLEACSAPTLNKNGFWPPATPGSRFPPRELTLRTRTSPLHKNLNCTVARHLWHRCALQVSGVYTAYTTATPPPLMPRQKFCFSRCSLFHYQ